jgi:glycosyltransferase involved in cell wall biosynthesis
MVGAGPLQPRLQEAIAARGLERTIALLGQREDVQQIVADSKVFVLTSRSEGLPIATAEAMVGGAVPVTADVGELSDFIDDGVNGYVVGSGDVDEFAQCAVALLRDDALRTRFSRAARAAALRHTGIDAVTERSRRDLRRVGGQAEAEGVQEKGICRV